LAVGCCSTGFEITLCRQLDFGRVGTAIDVIGKTAIGADFRLVLTDSEKGADAQRRNH
jgi:hypothetical protein